MFDVAHVLEQNTYLSKQNKVPFIIRHCDFIISDLNLVNIKWHILMFRGPSSIATNRTTNKKTIFTTVKPDKRCFKWLLFFFTQQPYSYKKLLLWYVELYETLSLFNVNYNVQLLICNAYKMVSWLLYIQFDRQFDFRCVCFN